MEQELQLTQEELCQQVETHPHAMEAAAQEMPSEERILALGELFKVFGDPTRLRILYALQAGELCVCDIAALLNMTQSAISHQLRVLKSAALVRYRREGKTVFYALADDHVHTILAQGYTHICE